MEIVNDIKYIGAFDSDIDLFESQYKVKDGISYNSYVILDEKVVVMDTVDYRKKDEWLNNLKTALNGRTVDYLVVNHMEPDHSANIKTLVEMYPNMKIVGNSKTFVMIKEYFDIDLTDKAVVVSEGQSVNIGKRNLQFFMAPMVHWPEVMVTYDDLDKILFSADAFGTFGPLDQYLDNWLDEARRYFINIVGKYGPSVQMLLKKAKNLDIKMICPLHGPVLKEELGYYIDKYNTWSLYNSEVKGVLVISASIHGHTGKIAKDLCQELSNNGVNSIYYDLTRADMSKVISECYKYSNIVFAACTYDAGLFPCMEDLLLHLKAKNMQNKQVALIENGTWAPFAAKIMRSYLEQMKNVTILENVVTIKGDLNSESKVQLDALIDVLKEIK